MRGLPRWNDCIRYVKGERPGNVSHRPLCLGRDPGAPDRPISIFDGWSNPLVLGAGKFLDSGFLNHFN